MIGAAGFMIWTMAYRPSAPQPAEIPVPTQPIPLGDAPVLGTSSAGVVLMEFADFECAYCSKFAREVFPTVRHDYVDRGLVRFTFRHLPLAKMHPHAEHAAAAAECARQQGLFWGMFDQLFKAPQELEDASLQVHARAIRMDLERFQGCLPHGAESQLKVDAELAKSLKLTGTPVFLVGRPQGPSVVRIDAVINGAQPPVPIMRETTSPLRLV
jgi:protein-disulfide isomerase